MPIGDVVVALGHNWDRLSQLMPLAKSDVGDWGIYGKCK